MPFLRRRPLLRAAAVGGGAYAYGKHRERVSQEQQEDAYGQGMQDASTQAAAPAASPGGGLTEEDTNRLMELGKLHEQGVLTDEEFAQQKARILGAG
jgi:putative oligomerization/nucleic acid binding protein